MKKMKTKFLTLLLGLFTMMSYAQLTLNPIPMEDITGNECIKIVFAGDGFTDTEELEFFNLAKQAREIIENVEPFASYISDFGFYTMFDKSVESGVGQKASVMTSCPNTNGGFNNSLPAITKNTYWKVTSNRANLLHYYGMDAKKRMGLEQRLKFWTPNQHERVFVIMIANTTDYGGSADFPTLAQYPIITQPKVSLTIITKNPTYFEFLLIHEFGHGFGWLDDEYDEADSPGVTCALTTFEPHLWNHPIRPNISTIQLPTWHEGGRYMDNGRWRETDNSIMRADYGATSFTTSQKNMIKDRINDEKALNGCN